jgi:hypothetical protein
MPTSARYASGATKCVPEQVERKLYIAASLVMFSAVRRRVRVAPRERHPRAVLPHLLLCVCGALGRLIVVDAHQSHIHPIRLPRASGRSPPSPARSLHSRPSGYAFGTKLTRGEQASFKPE